MKLILSITLLSFFKTQHICAQHFLMKEKDFKKGFYVSSSLIISGLIASTNNLVLNKKEIQEERNEWLPNFRTHIDDYLQYAPILLVYGLNITGENGRHNFLNRTALLIKSELIMGGLVYSIKNFTKVPRPDNGALNSFPSGHTAQAFLAATFMAKEYGNKNVLYSVLAYGMATSVATLRVLNNRHWISDVLVGAGIGIFSVEFSYLTHQYKWENKKNKLSLNFTPILLNNGGGITISGNF